MNKKNYEEEGEKKGKNEKIKEKGELWYTK